MTKVSDLHEEHNIFPEKTNFHLSHSYDKKTQSWKFMGWRCMMCGTVFKHESTIYKHESTCRSRSKGAKKEIDSDLTIIDSKGMPWKPLDINQNPTS